MMGASAALAVEVRMLTRTAEGRRAEQLSDSQWLRRMLLSVGEQLSYGDYAKLVSAARTHAEIVQGYTPYRVAILRNHTVDPLVQVIEGEVWRAGFAPEIHVGEYDASAQEALDPGSALYAFKPDLILLLNWIEGLSPALCRQFLTLDKEDRDREIERLRRDQAVLLDALRKQSDAPILVNNHPLPAAPTLGILDAQTGSGQADAIACLNAALREDSARVQGVHTIDLRRIMSDVGWSGGVDERMWHLARAPFTNGALLEIGREIGKFVRALRGGVRKCLVLDCDNTLWGGVVGEDGLGGIALSQSHPGSGFLALQQEAKNLAARGVLLALCTKNNREDVLEVLNSHPDMLLRERDFVAMQINWTDKVDNLRAIAAELNIGIDSLVLVDDSVFEIENVRERLPQVATIHLDGKPSTHAAKLARCGLFDSLSFSQEDRERSEMYRADKVREELRGKAGSLEEYLAGLEIVADIGPIAPGQAPRVSQLTQKTNQFNMTTRRLSEADIERMASAQDGAVYQLTARDRASNLGLVGVAAVRYADGRAEITDFLMSCRALGRGLEDALVATIASDARKRAATTIVGRFVATKKNQLSSGFYEKRGFELAGRNAEDGGEDWTASLASDVLPFPAWVSVQDKGQDV
jgi:FkbH-like protein